MSIEAMKRHLGKAKKLKIGDDVFNIPPLSVEYLPEFFGIMTSIQAEDESEVVKNLSKEVMEDIMKLVRVTCERSPDIDTSDQGLYDEFVAANFFNLMMCMLEVNTEVVSKDPSLLKKIKKRQKGVKADEEHSGDTG